MTALSVLRQSSVTSGLVTQFSQKCFVWRVTCQGLGQCCSCPGETEHRRHLRRNQCLLSREPVYYHHHHHHHTRPSHHQPPSPLRALLTAPWSTWAQQTADRLAGGGGQDEDVVVVRVAAQPGCSLRGRSEAASTVPADTGAKYYVVSLSSHHVNTHHVSTPVQCNETINAKYCNVQNTNLRATSLNISLREVRKS